MLKGKMSKYVRTKQNQIIVFPESIEHREFDFLEPISAGFISINKDEDGSILCSCFGRSYSLGLNSKPEEDTQLAKIQLFNKL